MLPLPPHYRPDAVGQVWRVPYEERARDAERWAQEHGLRAAANDSPRICLVVVDVQNTFCTPGFELFVGGRSGTGAVDDNRRLCEFLYRNLDSITKVVATLDTHRAVQIFHAAFLVGPDGVRPEPYTLVSWADVESGRWQVDPDAATALGYDPERLRRHLVHYVQALAAGGKYQLTVWPYHAMLGGIGHALASSVEEAIFFHGIARSSQPSWEVKGDHPLTEHYSMLGPEVTTDAEGAPLGVRNDHLVNELLEFDAVIVAGQAKSHCVAWTIDDLLRGVAARDPDLAAKVYLLEDCSSPVVVPGVVDYTDDADAAFRRFQDAGMHVVRSTAPIESWADMRSRTLRS